MSLAAILNDVTEPSPPHPRIVLFPDILPHYYDMLLTRGKINYFY